jgi:hypothetical protein
VLLSDSGAKDFWLPGSDTLEACREELSRAGWVEVFCPTGFLLATGLGVGILPRAVSQASARGMEAGSSQSCRQGDWSGEASNCRLGVRRSKECNLDCTGLWSFPGVGGQESSPAWGDGGPSGTQQASSFGDHHWCSSVTVRRPSG